MDTTPQVPVKCPYLGFSYINLSNVSIYKYYNTVQMDRARGSAWTQQPTTLYSPSDSASSGPCLTANPSVLVGVYLLY